MQNCRKSGGAGKLARAPGWDPLIAVARAWLDQAG
jgi:hypothetical protein